MIIRLNLFTLMLPALALLAGCIALGEQRSVAQPRIATDQYSLEEARIQSSTGCDFTYRIYSPDHPVSTTRVMLGHGFLRNQDRLVDLSRALANQGIPVITLNYCNMRPWNGHHVQNAADMRALATATGTQDDIIYAGFSAGALAAVLAADNNTKAILTLDLVDQADLGLTAIQQLNVPLIGLHGPSSKCNAANNGLTIYKARPKPAYSKSVLIEQASHCEFESPSNWLCEISCGDDTVGESARTTRQRVIDDVIDLVTPYLSPPASALPAGEPVNPQTS